MDMITVQFGKDRYHQQNEMISWCHANVGQGGWRIPNSAHIGDHWGVESCFGNTMFHFLDEKYATLFTLRWS
jgi:hypothetical protein